MSELHHALVQKPFSINAAMKNSEVKAAGDEVWDKLRMLPAWSFKIAKPEAAVTRHAKHDGRSVHFASLWERSYWKHAELARKLQVQPKSCARRRHG